MSLYPQKIIRGFITGIRLKKPTPSNWFIENTKVIIIEINGGFEIPLITLQRLYIKGRVVWLK